MHLGLNSLSTFFSDQQGVQELVLAVVVATEGSTYRKPGALMLMAEGGQREGLISGGCLEDDLFGHAQTVFARRQAKTVVYDLNDDPELVWGLGLGCGGSVRVLLAPLSIGANLAVMQKVFQAASQGTPAALSVAFESTSDVVPVGTMAALIDGTVQLGAPELAQALATERFEQGRSASRLLPHSERELGVLHVRMQTTPHVLVCGAGPDAVPVVQQVLALGWNCTVVDHRSAYARASRFPTGARVLCQRPEQLSALVNEAISAAVVMSHHVDHDTAYLRELAQKPPVYIGLLGPRKRRDALLETLGEHAPKVRGPAGLDIGAELPESIALAIISEIHACLNARSGGALSEE